MIIIIQGQANSEKEHNMVQYGSIHLLVKTQPQKLEDFSQSNRQTLSLRPQISQNVHKEQHEG